MSTPLSAALPLVAYAEALASQARVLIVGDARSPLPRAVLERGARLVHVCDVNAARLAEAQAKNGERAITFGRLDDGPAALREGFFELVLVENLSAEANAEQTLAAVARLLAPRGVALIAAPNPDATAPLLSPGSNQQPLDYYALYDAATAAFPEVRMLGQVPFVGYALVDFSAELEPTPVLDASLLPPRGEEPDYFVALAARQRRALDQYAVIQLPLSQVRANAGALAKRTAAAPSSARALAPTVDERAPKPAAAKPTAPSSALQQQLERQEHWIAELEARATTADERADEADERADAAETRASEAEARANALASRASDAEARATALESRASAAEARATALESRANEAESRAESAQKSASELSTRIAGLERNASELVRERDALRAELDQLRARVGELEATLATREAELSALGDEAESASELTALEKQLRERGEHISALQRSLREAERIGRELVRKLRDSAPPAQSGELTAQLAQAEAEIATLRWSLALTVSQKGGAAGTATH